MKIKLMDVFKIKGRKILGGAVSNLEKLEIEIDRLENLKKQTDSSYYDAKARQEEYKGTCDKIRDKVNALMESAKRVVDDDSLLMRHKKEIDRLNGQIEVLENQIETTGKIVDKIYQQKNIIAGKLSTLKGKYDTLKMKDQFAKDVNGFVNSGVIDAGTGVDISDIEKEINIGYSSKSIQLDDIIKESTELDVTSVTEEEELKKFKASLELQ